MKGQNTSHVLHLILTLLTVGVWGIIWIAMVFFNRTQRQTVSVDEWGNVNIQK